MSAQEGPYVFRASQAEQVAESDRLKIKEAHMPDGMIVRYQERSLGGDENGAWCETGHSAYTLSGRLRYEFPDHEVEIGPGNTVHIPAGHAHRYRPHEQGRDPVKYFITEFS